MNSGSCSQISSSCNCPIEEIEKAIKKLKNKKAAGLDGIRNEMIKTSSRFIKYPLEKLFNLILQSGIVLE